MLRIICFILIIIGGMLILFTAFKYNKLFKNIDKGNGVIPTYSGLINNILRLILVFFIIGFVAGAAGTLFDDIHQPIYYIVGIVFFAASLFAFFIIRHLSLMANALSEKSKQFNAAVKQIEDQNIRLQSEVDIRVKKIVQQDKLLHTVNDMASLLLASDTDEFNEILFKCMGMLAASVGVDRTYIWENYINNGKLYCTQLAEWSGGADPQQGNELTVNVAFPADWYGRLSSNECVNGIVSTFPKREREHLQAQGIVSILVVPVFLHDQFWGFVGFDDCQNERTFSDAEEVILRSASLLIATSLLRNEITENLVTAREEALSSTKAKSNFLSNMSHEIRTPINAITGMTAIARMSSDAKTVANCLNKIDAASYQLLGLINDVLDMSKIEAGKMELANETFDLHKMIENVKSMMDIRAAEKDQTLSVNLSKDMPAAVVGDDVRLSQILINLLSNAVKFTPVRGKITLNMRLAEKKEDKYVIKAEVCDNGIGIDPQQQARIFSAFEQADRNTSRNFGGTGLGLPISKNIAKLMGGDITIESEPGEGSCFIVYFMLKNGDEAHLTEKNANTDLSENDFSKNTVLLVEDIAINREIVSAILKPTRISVDYAENGEDALKIISENPDKYDIIFMDIQMPGMDGYQTTQNIRALNNEKAKKIPIIAMTANAYKEDVDKALESGMNGHLSKPINIEAVITVLKHYLV